MSGRRVVMMGAIMAITTLAANPVTAQTKLLRFPDIHGDQVVFCYGGDLWTASSQGGRAQRLTAHPGQELVPKFSPDGKGIAFTGQYDGDEQVYLMPTAGGVPKQLTYYPAVGPLPPRWGYDHQVYGWTPDGSKLLFRSLRDTDGIENQTALYTVDIDGGLPVKLPMPTSGAGDFSPDGARIVYSPLFRDFRTWKRYEGGWAQDLYIFDLEGHVAEKIAAGVRTERDPMWIGDTIYFASDRDGTLNLYAYGIDDGDVRQLTHETTWDVRWPSSDNRGRIVYELDGELHVHDIGSGSDSKLSITVPDDGLAMRPSRYPAYENIEGVALSPKGERAVFTARGDVFTVPIEKGPTRNLTHSSSAHDKRAVWSPNGGHLAFSMRDVNGFNSIYIWSVSDGVLRRITSAYHEEYGPVWGVEGNYLYYLSDREYAPQISQIEWNIAGNRMTGIFAIALRGDVENPFGPESDEVTTGDEEVKDDSSDNTAKKKKSNGADKAKDEKKKEPIAIDFDGLADRVTRVPVEAANIGGLAAIESHLLYSERGAPFYGRQSAAKPSLHIFELSKRKASTLVEDMSGYVVSADGKKVLVHQGKAYKLYDAKPKAKDPKTIDTKHMMVDRVPSEEWAQIFDEVWRRYRDFFYVPNMHGYDWPAIGEQYRQLVPHVAHRLGGEAPLPRLGARKPRARERGDGRPRRLHALARHGGGRDCGVHQVVLPADPKGGTDRRRPLQRRRQRLPDHHRTAR